MAIKLPKELEVEVYRCFRCGYCRSQCVVFKAKQNESWNTRGKMILIKLLMEGKLTASSPVLERLYCCSLCRACETTCPAVVRLCNIFTSARAEMHHLGLWPGVLKNLAASVEGQKNIYDMPNDERNIWAMDLEENVNLQVGKKAEVAYFVGCLSSFMGRLAGIPSSMTRIMDHAGVDFTVLESKEWCCGNPLFLAGVPELTEQVVKHNVSTLRELRIKTLVVTCAGCYRAWKQEYPEVLGEDFGFEVLHSSEFLARLIDDDKLKFKGGLKGVTTYHDPCEIGRYCNIYEAPRKVLENIPNVRFVELFKTRKECTCCGGGGLLKAISPDLALEIAFQKLDEVIATDANIVTSGCPACKLNISDAILERKSALEMVDITEIVARALSASE